MLSDTYKSAFKFKPQPSQQLLLLIILLHSCAGLIIIFLLMIPWLQQGLLLFIISIAGYLSYRLHYKKTSKASIIAVHLSIDNQWSIVLAQPISLPPPQPLPAVLLDSSLLNYSLMILNFRIDSGKTYSVILPPDALKATLARQIRARIKVMSGEDVARL